MLWIISDTHFWHRNIIKYTGRTQFMTKSELSMYNKILEEPNLEVRRKKLKAMYMSDYSIQKMNNTLVNSWSNIVSKNDIVIHLGDFAFCNIYRLRNLVSQLNGKIFLIPGNHDRPTTLSRCGIIILSSAKKEESRLYMNNLIFSHRPLYEEEIPPNYINVHGHIHNKKSYYRHINVSCDVTNFRPVSLSEVKEKAKNA